MSEKLKAGDVVQLKSGGPLMTVQSLNQAGAICTWFDSKNSLQSSQFPEIALEKYEEPDGSAFIS